MSRVRVRFLSRQSTSYRDPRRANEVKRTNPTLQAKHWFAHALLKMMRLRGPHFDLALAMAFPTRRAIGRWRPRPATFCVVSHRC